MEKYYGRKRRLMNKAFHVKGGQESERLANITSNSNERGAKCSGGTGKRSGNRWMSAREVGYWRIIMCTTCVSLHVHVMFHASSEPLAKLPGQQIPFKCTNPHIFATKSSSRRDSLREAAFAINSESVESIYHN